MISFTQPHINVCGDDSGWLICEICNKRTEISLFDTNKALFKFPTCCNQVGLLLFQDEVPPIKYPYDSHPRTLPTLEKIGVALPPPLCGESVRQILLSAGRKVLRACKKYDITIHEFVETLLHEQM